MLALPRFGKRGGVREPPRPAMGRMLLWGKLKIAQPILGAIPSRMAFRSSTRWDSTGHLAGAIRWQASQEVSSTQVSIGLFASELHMQIRGSATAGRMLIMDQIARVAALGKTAKPGIDRCASDSIPVVSATSEPFRLFGPP